METDVSDTDIFASSTCNNNIMYECCLRSNEKIGFLRRRLQENVSVFRRKRCGSATHGAIVLSVQCSRSLIC